MAAVKSHCIVEASIVAEAFAKHTEYVHSVADDDPQPLECRPPPAAHLLVADSCCDVAADPQRRGIPLLLAGCAGIWKALLRADAQSSEIDLHI